MAMPPAIMRKNVQYTAATYPRLMEILLIVWCVARIKVVRLAGLAIDVRAQTSWCTYVEPDAVRKTSVPIASSDERSTAVRPNLSIGMPGKRFTLCAVDPVIG
ncbi:hypothetical protein ASE59_07765 [Sphingomonas sp. Leaf10]|nr:hypothetical protein ASE59_07765 [Sphingomonas sp. Leaf10]